ncbi:MAG: succinate dehydrogenase/fumarate reductase cytochrome b subunit [Bacteroidales bacterium]|nr:succinate dehydrogenase/fumarate reductase cytochrome b subunit [Bacteroidales bacterium]
MSNPNFLSSSIGKKFLMSITGLFLILFLAFHATMNLVAIFSAEAYNAVCEFLGTNWYALIGTAVLAVGTLVHIAYAFILSIQNSKARGNNKYDSQVRPASVEWASKNMLVLGVIVLCGIGLHLSQFWYKMMFAELAEMSNRFAATDGAAWISYYFAQWPVVVAYIVWLVALWFHLTHGFWSALQTIGWNNKIWLPRLKCISDIFATIVCCAFAAVVIVAFCQSL